MILVERLKTYYPGDLAGKYGIEVSDTDTVEDVFAKIAVARGCLKAGGTLDIDKVIQLVLRDFRTGRLGRFTLDNPDRK